jgi:hypothetical protein
MTISKNNKIDTWLPSAAEHMPPLACHRDTERKSEKELPISSGLPDGLLPYEKSQCGGILEGLLENVGIFYDHLE